MFIPDVRFFICDQTTMAQEHKSLLTTSFPGSLFVGENPGNEVEI